jgi:hypothetical protein
MGRLYASCCWLLQLAALRGHALLLLLPCAATSSAEHGRNLAAMLSLGWLPADGCC